MGPESDERCSFKISYDKGYQCPHPAADDGLCIFHLPKAIPNPLVIVYRLQAFEKEFERFIASLSASAVWDFRGFQFPPIVSFANQSYDAIIHFEHAVFAGIAVFGGCVFKKPVYFSSASFHESAVFNDTTFMSPVRFMDTRFGQRENLDQSRYSAIFMHARFASSADFTEAVFRTKGLFLGTQFDGDASFERTIFFNEASFQDATFHKTAVFRGGLGNFHRVTTACFSERCDFRDVSLGEGADLCFEDVNLDQARFTGTNLDRITFRNVEWHRKRQRFSPGRQALAEEFQLPPGWGDGERDIAIRLGDELLFGAIPKREQRAAAIQKAQSHYAKVAENYTQLVRNYERQYEFATADDFYVGAMEARRKNRLARIRTPWLRWVRRWMGVEHLYWILSRYGTSYRVAVMWLVVWMLTFAAAFLVVGIEPADQQLKGSASVIRYDFFSSDVASLGLQKLAIDYLKALTIPLAAVLEQPGIYRPVGAVGWTLAIVQLSLVTLQGYFVALALKRKFKRG